MYKIFHETLATNSPIRKVINNQVRNNSDFLDKQKRKKYLGVDKAPIFLDFVWWVLLFGRCFQLALDDLAVLVETALYALNRPASADPQLLADHADQALVVGDQDHPTLNKRTPKNIQGARKEFVLRLSKTIKMHRHDKIKRRYPYCLGIQKKFAEKEKTRKTYCKFVDGFAEGLDGLYVQMIRRFVQN